MPPAAPQLKLVESPTPAPASGSARGIEGAPPEFVTTATFPPRLDAGRQHVCVPALFHSGRRVVHRFDVRLWRALVREVEALLAPRSASESESSKGQGEDTANASSRRPRHVITAADLDAAWALYSAGTHTIRQCAEHVGCTESALFGHLGRAHPIHMQALARANRAIKTRDPRLRAEQVRSYAARVLIVREERRPLLKPSGKIL